MGESEKGNGESEKAKWRGRGFLKFDAQNPGG
jgi:hypothetical protein